MYFISSSSAGSGSVTNLKVVLWSSFEICHCVIARNWAWIWSGPSGYEYWVRLLQVIAGFLPIHSDTECILDLSWSFFGVICLLWSGHWTNEKPKVGSPRWLEAAYWFDVCGKRKLLEDSGHEYIHPKFQYRVLSVPVTGYTLPEKEKKNMKAFYLSVTLLFFLVY